ncbi:MAG: alpha/beta fold hydrolase [Actinomycetota bacterium]|nr:alpha/beta fold hydrolase [Actinomycetota bacterium]MDA3008409.1 alpha/beta fold hydrolase [Actinomycetota bacterium]MDA3037869.1 alpha/beta fold hydrolase [Actinomycetota bacterium]
MRFFKKKTISVILILTLILGLTGFYFLGRYAYFAAGTVSCGISGEYSDLNNSPSNFSLDWEKYPDLNLSPYFIDTFESFNVKDGEVILSGWWFDNPNSEKTVIVLHGVGSSKQSAGVLTSAGMLNKSNFDVVVFDYQDHGSSTCLDKVHGAGVHEAYNTSAVIEWLVEEKNKTKENIGLLGFSLGAMVALNTHGLSDNFSSSIVVDPPVDFDTILREELEFQGVPSIVASALRFFWFTKTGESIDALTPEKALSNGNLQELLIVSNLLDERVKPHHRDKLVSIAQKLGIPHSIKYYENYGHVENIWGSIDEWENTINNYFNRTLSG